MKPRLRAPFVATVAVMATMNAACGDKETATYNPPFDSGAAPDVEGPDTIDASVRPDATQDVDAVTDARDAIVNPAECPKTDPGFGAIHKPCTAGASVRCAYEDLCPQRPAGQTENVYACHDDGTGDHWTLVSKDYVPSCPATEPKPGDACPCTIHMAFVACNYGVCEDFTRTYAACKGIDTFDQEWKVTPIACNPPEPDGGFADGDALDGD
jgi:hypothetical protein